MKNLIKRCKNSFPQNGLTLVELLITLAILGMMVAVLFAIVNPLEQNRKANDAIARNTAAEFLQASLRYNTDNGSYPWNTSLCINYPTPLPTTPPTPIPTGVLANLPPNILHYWTMNGAANAAEADIGNQSSPRPLSLGGAVGTTAGVSSNTGTARVMTAFAGYYLYSPRPDTLPATGAYTVNFWVQTSQTTEAFMAMNNYNLPGNDGFTIYDNYGGNITTMMVSLTNGNASQQTNISIPLTNNIDDNNWHMITLSFTGDTTANGVKFYVDCSSPACPLTAATALGPRSGNTGYFGIPNYINQSTDLFAGNYDEVGIWNRVLSPTEISNMYNYYKAVAPTSAPTPTPLPGGGLQSITTPAPLSTVTSCIQTMSVQGDLKNNFNNISSSVLQNVYLSQPNPILTPPDPSSLIVCYLPKSRTGQQDPQAKYVQNGYTAPYTGGGSTITGYDVNGVPQSTDTCISAGGNNYCYVCVY